jgi:hypothetical protein
VPADPMRSAGRAASDPVPGSEMSGLPAAPALDCDLEDWDARECPPEDWDSGALRGGADDPDADGPPAAGALFAEGAGVMSWLPTRSWPPWLTWPPVTAWTAWMTIS